MYLIACVDDRMGMLFNHRRVSRDKKVSLDILDLCKENYLYIEESSALLFAEVPCEKIRIIKDFSSADLKGQYVFLENPEKIQEQDTEEIILYRWNRKYPADRYFPIDLTRWKMLETWEFPGNSHEKITKERYEKYERKK
ncbi:MAG: ribonuclease Z [Blautia sp.]